MKHNLAIFKEDGKWYVGIDGEQKLSVDVDVELGDESYLCAGAASYKELKMSILNVYTDSQVTDKMKGGVLKASAVSTGSGGKQYGPGGTSFTLEDLKNFDSANESKNAVRHFSAIIFSIKWYQWILALAICAGIAGSSILIFKARKK